MNQQQADRKAEELDHDGVLFIREDELQDVWKACQRRGILYDAYQQPTPCGTHPALRLEKKGN